MSAKEEQDSWRSSSSGSMQELQYKVCVSLLTHDRFAPPSTIAVDMLPST